MPGHRTKCYFCKESVLSRDIGRHIFKNHEEALMKGSKHNIEDLYRDKYLKEPLQLFIGEETFFFCLEDNSCIRHSINATNHFKGKAEKHKEGILALREKYPMTGSTASTSSAAAAPSPPLWTEKEKKKIEEEFCLLAQNQFDLYKHYRVNEMETFEWDKKVVALFQKVGILIDIKDLKEKYPNSFGIEEEEEEEEQSEEDYEEPPPLPEEPEEEEEQQTFEVLDRRFSVQDKPLPKVTPTLPKPSPDVYLPHVTRQSTVPSMKIIQSTKRPPTQ